MDNDLIDNIIVCAVFGSSIIGTLVGIIFFGAYWHIFTLIISLIFFLIAFTDKEHIDSSLYEIIKTKLSTKFFKR